MSNLNQFFGVIKSIQRGVTSATDSAVTDITISSVDTAKSFVSASNTGGRYRQAAAPTGAYGISAGATLTSSTNLRLGSVSIGDSGAVPVVNWEVIEYY